MQSDVLNESQHSNNDNESSANSFPTHTATTLIYSGLKLHPKPLVPTISMPGVASPLSIVKKLPIPDSHLDNSIRNSTGGSSIRLVTPTTGKSSPPNSTNNGTFATSKAFILNSPSTNSSNATPLLTLIPPGTTSPKIQTLNSVTISTNNDFNTNSNSTATDLSVKTSSLTNTNPSVFLTKNRVTLITNPPSTSSTTTNNVTTVPPKLVIQQNSNSTIWPQQNSTKIISIPSSAKVLSRPVQLIPTSLSSNEHSTHITHVQTVKTDKHENLYPLNVHFGLSSPTTNETSLNLHHGHSLTTKTLDQQTAFIHMQLLPSTNNESSPVQLTLPTTHLYSSTPSLFISNHHQRSSMDINNNHQNSPTITTPIIREMNIEEKLSESSFIKTSTKTSTKNRTRLPLQPSAQQVSLGSSSTASTSTSTSTPTTSNIRQPKKHKLIEDEQTSSNEPPTKVTIYEQFDSTTVKSRPRPLTKVSIENATPSSSTTIEFAKKRSSAETANAAILSRKRRLISKVNPNGISNENLDEESINERRSSTNGNEIDDELLKRLSQDFVYVDQRTGIRWIGSKTRPKSLTSLVSRFSWKPKINHYEKYSDIIRTNPKRTVPIQSFDQLKKKLSQPWASWRIDRLTHSLADLTRDEQTTENQLSDIIPLLTIIDPIQRTTIDDLIQANLQRHRSFSDQLKQISDVLLQSLDHGNQLRDVCSISKINANGNRRTKER